MQQGTTIGTAPTKGVYYAEIINTAGSTFKSNTITITTKEQAAVIKDVEIVEDYTTPDLEYVAKSDYLVVKFNINYPYEGNFYLVDSSKTEYTTTNMVGAAAEFVATDGDKVYGELSGFLTNIANNTAETKASNMTAKNALAAGDGKGICYKNEDGSYDVMFRLKADGESGAGDLTRGKSYKLIFDQDSLDEDTITSVKYTDGSSEQTTNAPNISDAFTVPYIKAPASIALTKRVASGNPEITLYGDDGKALAWFGQNKSAVAQTMTVLGVTAKVYEEKSTTKSKESTKPVKAADTSKAGVITSTEALSNSGYDYYWASVELAKGIYGAAKVSLESDIVEASGAIGTISGIASDTSAVSTAKISLQNVKDAATVYIYNEDPTSFTAAQLESKALGSASVAKGASSALIENVITKVGAYYAALVPVDDKNFSKDIKNYAIVSKPTTVKVGESDAIQMTTASGVHTITGLVAVDQFGEVCSSPVTTEMNAPVTAQNAVTASPAAFTGKYVVGATGEIKLTVTQTNTSANIAKGDGFTVSILGSSLQIVAGDSGIAANNGGGTATSKATLDGSTVALSGTAAVRVGTAIKTTVSDATGTTVLSDTNLSSNDKVITASDLTVLDQFGDTINKASDDASQSGVTTTCAIKVTESDGTAKAKPALTGTAAWNGSGILTITVATNDTDTLTAGDKVIVALWNNTITLTVGANTGASSLAIQ